MENPKRKRSTATAPDVDLLASKAAKALHKAARACLDDESGEGKGGHLACAILGFAAVAADNHRALADVVGSRPEALLSGPLALVEATVTKRAMVESGPAARPAEGITTPTNTDVQDK